ncbi:TsaC protein [Chitinispirillum alkaliphilum]|nr:TsaC protein [Chitinispirillum alkaliphilum]
MDGAEQISRAAGIIKQGGVVAFPTETVYGLGTNAFNEKSVARVFEVKKRPSFDPLIVHIDNENWLTELVHRIPEKAKILIDAFWPGPLSIVLPKRSKVPDIVTAGLPGVALRMPSNLVALTLIREAGVPLAAPSANPFGAISPTLASHVKEQLGEDIDMILDGGPCSVGIESTVISFLESEPVLLRAGGAELEEIQKLIGKVKVASAMEHISHSPGRCERHYSPSTPLTRLSDPKYIPTELRAGLISVAPIEKKNLPPNIVSVEILSGSGDLREAACNLFAAMRRLDSSDLEVIYSLPLSNQGLGLAINDRLSRAAVR